jgi:hypothetical protein
MQKLEESSTVQILNIFTFQNQFIKLNLFLKYQFIYQISHQKQTLFLANYFIYFINIFDN